MTTQSRMIDMLPYYLRNGSSINKYYIAIAKIFDEIIEVFVDIQNSRDIDKSWGFGLDIIGDILGEERNGLDDESFRAVLRTKIISNRSTGDIETLNDFGRLILGQFFEGIIDSNNPAEMILRYTFPLVKDPVGLMNKAKAAGVKIITQMDSYVPVCGTVKAGSMPLTKKLTSI